ISAQEALQKVLDDTNFAGKMENFHSGSTWPQEWYPTYPDNQPITLYGNVSSFQNAEVAKPPLILIDGAPAIGNTAGLEKMDNYNFIAAQGQFLIEGGIRKFQVASWTTNIQTLYVSGMLQREGAQVLIASDEGDGKK